MCISLTPDCTRDQLLTLWHHECDWLYGKRMIDQVDEERYQLAFKTVVKANFDDQNELSMLNSSSFFSNLRENESGIVVAGLSTSNFFDNNSSNGGGAGSNSNSSNSSSGGGGNNGGGKDSAGGSETQSGDSTGNNGGGGSGGGGGGGKMSMGHMNVWSDNYTVVENVLAIRKLVQTSLDEYNKEQQRIYLPLYESTLALITRLSHTIQSVGGNCCLIANGGLSRSVVHLVAFLMRYQLVQFKMSQYTSSRDVFFAQLKQKLISSYYKAGIRGEKIMIFLSEEEMAHTDFLTYITEFLVTEEVMHLFTIEEETNILNSIRTQVLQSGQVYTRETAWEFFVK